MKNNSNQKLNNNFYSPNSLGSILGEEMLNKLRQSINNNKNDDKKNDEKSVPTKGNTQ